MTLKTYLLVFIIMSLVLPAFAQTVQIDSLDQLIEKVNTDTGRIDLQLQKARRLTGTNIPAALDLYQKTYQEAIDEKYRKGQKGALRMLARYEAITGDRKRAFQYLDILKKMSSTAKDSIEIGEMQGSFGDVHAILQEYDQAIAMLKKAIGIIERNGHSPDLGLYYNGLAIAYQAKANYQQALVYQQAALRFSETGKDVSSQATVLVNMANTYSFLQDYERTEETFKEAIAIAEKNNITRVEVYAYSNLASINMLLKKWQKAYDYAMKAIDLGKKTGDRAIQAASYSKASASLAEIGRFEEAGNLAEKAIAIADSVGQKYNRAQAYASMGSVLRLQKEYREAIPFYKEALSNVNTDGFDDFTGALFDMLSECYKKTGDIKSTLESYRKYTAIKDSVRSRENIQKATEQRMNFEFDKKQAIAQAEQDLKDAEAKRERNQQYFAIGFLALFLMGAGIIAFLQYRSKRHKQRANLLLKEEKQKVETTLTELKTTQTQLIQSEKMASLGELTAGIAHEIQNPLNFVNNFSEVSSELVVEMKEELVKGNYEDAEEIAEDLKINLEKINHHGKRADAIVKGMLQHSRKSTAEKEPTDINALCDEYLRLSYHGLRARDKNFNAALETDFDESIGLVKMIPQDMGRVILNLITNAFYAVTEQKIAVSKDLSGFQNLTGLDSYQPKISVSTKKIKDKIEIKISDNGNGIPANVLGKIFQPFFTTKPTGKGTGLGLSISYDIVKAHGGTLEVQTEDAKGTTFIIYIPK